MSRRSNSEDSLLLLAPSNGFGGGIERMADSIESAWPGPVTRLNLYHPDEVDRPERNLPAKLRFTRRLASIVVRDRPSRILALHINLLWLALMAERLAGAKAAMFAIGVEVWEPLSPPTRLAVRRCKSLLSISAFTAEWFARRANIDPSTVKVIPLPVNGSLAAAAFDEEATTRIAGNGLGLLTVTRLAPEHRYKGYFAVAEALAQLRPRHPEITWTIAGFGRDLVALQQYCARLGITDAVTFAGRISDERLIDCYRHADVFVMPSVADPEADPPIGEGFGLVYAEAGAFGVPAIASTAGGGALEFVANGETGLTVPPDDVSGLAAAVERLVEDTPFREELGERAKARVIDRHLPARFTEALVASLGD